MKSKSVFIYFQDITCYLFGNMDKITVSSVLTKNRVLQAKSQSYLFRMTTKIAKLTASHVKYRMSDCFAIDILPVC